MSYAKALVGSVVSALGVIATGLQAPGGLSAYVYVTAVIAFLTSFGTIFQGSNKSSGP